MPHIPTVLPVGNPSAARAGDCETLAGPRRDPDQLPAGLYSLDLHHGQLRQQDLQLDNTQHQPGPD